MARKFFYVCAGMLMLALSYHLGAATVSARSLASAVPTEVAMLQGTLNVGETIPLPTYEDGTSAAESDCRWIVSRATDNDGSGWCYSADAYYPAIAGAPGTPTGPPTKSFLDAHRGRVANAGQNEGAFIPATVTYLIIATRSTAQPTQASRTSWSQVKARYQTPAGGSVTPEAQDR